MSIKERLKRFVKETKGLTIQAFEKSIGASNGYVNSISKGIGGIYLERIRESYPELDINWLLTGKLENEQSLLKQGIYEEKKNIMPLSNSKLIEKNHIKVVTIIPAKAQLGLQGTMFKEDFIGKLETKVIETEDNWQGRYFDIESTGESMINEDEPELSIYDGDELRVREIPRDLYINNKLHINEWREFTFFHYDRGIFTKNILEHNVSERKVLVHSYNRNKEDYPDEWISLNDCYIVCNVISVTRPRGIKKRLQKLTGTK